jgi:hypothetical protein
MLRFLLEMLPLLGGCLHGLSASKAVWRTVTFCLFLGTSSAWLAGELSKGFPEATLAIVIDSLAALVASACIRQAQRFTPGSQL